ncbi:MAG: alpha/beta hydrolase [Dehalococcoidia bacterium]|nr:alpha/beta hydrolase [Dehalococcoidia bacterium]
MPYASVNGVDLYYEEHGSGYPLVWSHEFAGDYRSWKPQVQFFSRRYRVITYNARGYPPSDVPESLDDYTQEQAVDDLKGLLEHLSIERAHIGGLSMGGNVALNFGLTYPEMARSLIVAGTGSGSTDVEPFRRNVNARADIMRAGGMEAMGDYLNSGTRVQLRRKDPVGYEEFRQGFLEHSPIGSASTFAGIQGRRPSIFDLEERMRAMDVPTLIMTGDEDEPCIEPSVFMKRCIPRSGLVMMPQAGHAINLEDPDVFNRIVLDFLTAVEQGSWATREWGDESGALV